MAPAPLKSRRGPWFCTNFRAMANIPQLFPFLDSAVPLRCYSKWWIWMHTVFVESWWNMSISFNFPMLAWEFLSFLHQNYRISEFPISWASMCGFFRLYESAKKETSTKVQESVSRSPTFRIFHRNHSTWLQFSFPLLIRQNSFVGMELEQPCTFGKRCSCFLAKWTPTKTYRTLEGSLFQTDRSFDVSGAWYHQLWQA